MNESENEVYSVLIDEIKIHLNTIRTDINDIKKSMVNLVKLENEVSQQQKIIEHLLKRTESQDKRLQELEIKQALNTKSSGVFDRLTERMIMFVLGAIIMFVFEIFRK